MKNANSLFTPEKITSLSPLEVFCFGSNRRGNHYSGAAYLAHTRFKAPWGAGEGDYISTYAIPTLDEDYQKVTVDALKDSIRRFLQTVRSDRAQRFFLLTEIGTGIAGWRKEEIADALWEVILEKKDELWELRNLVLPRSFILHPYQLTLYSTLAEGRGMRLVKGVNDELYQNTKRSITDRILSILEELRKEEE